MEPYGKLQKGKGKFPPASGSELSGQFSRQFRGFGLYGGQVTMIKWFHFLLRGLKVWGVFGLPLRRVECKGADRDLF